MNKLPNIAETLKSLKSAIKSDKDQILEESSSNNPPVVKKEKPKTKKDINIFVLNKMVDKKGTLINLDKIQDSSPEEIKDLEKHVEEFVLAKIKPAIKFWVEKLLKKGC